VVDGDGGAGVDYMTIQAAVDVGLMYGCVGDREDL